MEEASCCTYLEEKRVVFDLQGCSLGVDRWSAREVLEYPDQMNKSCTRGNSGGCLWQGGAVVALDRDECLSLFGAQALLEKKERMG